MIAPYSDSYSSPRGHFLWYELITTNTEDAQAFYTRVVGWGIKDSAAPSIPYTFFTSAGAAVAGLMSLPHDGPQAGVRSGWIGYVGVHDVDRATARARELGATVRVPPKEIPGISRFA